MANTALELGSVVGGYRIDELIGRGGMGEIYRTTNVALGRIYALKVLAPELAGDEQFRERFRREMQIAASLHHPNIVSIHYAGEVQGMLFFVMDFIAGADLHAILRNSGQLEPGRATGLLTQLADALDAAHRRGLVHRDVKPANVLITVHEGEEHAYLTDFGVAKKFDATAELGRLTRQGTVLGTVDYMPPEQIVGGRVDARSDIYALGCLFFQMLTGEVLYKRENPVATMFAHLNDPPPRLTGGLQERYPNLSAVIEKATAKEPDTRYLSAGDFARDAAAALIGKRYTAAPTVVATGEATPVRGSVIPAQVGFESKAHPAVAAQSDFESEAKRGPRRPVPDQAARAQTPARAAAAAETRASSDPAEPAGEFGRAAQESPPPERRPRRPDAAPLGTPEPPAGRQWLGRYRWALVAVLICIAGGAAAAIALSSSSSPTNSVFSAAESPVPTNRVTGGGTAKVLLKSDIATITVDVHGLVNQLHWMHIHCCGICPTAAAAERKNGHSFISYYDGGEVYGPPVTSLTTYGDTSVDSYLNTTRYEKTGSFYYARTINLGVTVAKEIRDGLAVIVVHGINYDGKPVYDNYLGPGEEQGAPALCGVLSPGPTAAARAKSSQGTLYTASLRPLSTLQALEVLSPGGLGTTSAPWLCDGIDATSALPPTSGEARRFRGST